MDDGNRPRIPVDTFGIRLAVIRAELGLNIKEMAERCDISPENWRRWERGGTVQKMDHVARKIALATGYDYAWLMAGGPLYAAWDSNPQPTDSGSDLHLWDEEDKAA